MAVSSTSNSLNSTVRYTGLASGLDVDTLVTQMLSADNAKIDKVKQQRELALWKTEAYREITASLQSFYTGFFDVLQTTNNIKYGGSFASFSTQYSKTDASNYFTATSTAGAKSGTYSVSNIKKATTASVKSTADISAAITGATISDVSNISSLKGTNKFKLVLNGETKEIVLADNSDLQALADDLQNKIDYAFGENKITVNLDEDNGSITFDTVRDTDTFNLASVYNTGVSELFGKDLSSGFTTTAYNNKFDLTFGTEKKTIELPVGKTYSNTNEIIADLQSLVNNSSTGFGSGKILFENSENKITFRTIEENTYGVVGGVADKVILEDDKVTIDSSNKTMVIDIGTDTDVAITIDAGQYTRAELLAQIQSKIDQNEATKDLNIKVGINYDNKIQVVRGVYAAAADTGSLKALGFENAPKSNKIDTTATIDKIKDTLATPFAKGTPDADGNDIAFKINGKEFKFNSEKVSMKDIISAVNADTTANVTMKYDLTTNTISVESKSTGASQRLSMEDTNGNLLDSFGINNKSAVGTDASITINGTQTIVRSTNSFTYDGIAYNIKADYDGDAGNVTLTNDPTKVVSMIKEFITKYNEVIENINNKLSEKKDSNYSPLTDAQKEEMSETQITTWETKAKAGLLRNDSTLSEIVSNMRNALIDTVQGAGLSLYDLGITTSSTYSDKGKLVLDEQKLTDAITNNPDAVANLFTQESSVSYYDTLNGTADDRRKRYQESGLGQRLSDIIQDAIRTSTDKSGQKGSLLVKAGVEGDRSEYSNQLYDLVMQYDNTVSTLLDKLSDKQESYYNKFAALETAINKMNSQSSWLTSQFSSSS